MYFQAWKKCIVWAAVLKKANVRAAVCSFPYNFTRQLFRMFLLGTQTAIPKAHVFKPTNTEFLSKFKILLMHSFLNKSCWTWNTSKGIKKSAFCWKRMVLYHELKIHSTVFGVTQMYAHTYRYTQPPSREIFVGNITSVCKKHWHAGIHTLKKTEILKNFQRYLTVLLLEKRKNARKMQDNVK